MKKNELKKYIELLLNGDWEEEQLFVYRYNSISYIGLFLLCLGLGLFMLVGAFINLASNGMELGFVLLFGGAMFITFGMVFWLSIIRSVLIFYPGDWYIGTSVVKYLMLRIRMFYMWHR